jgi:hypothetical protein
MSGVLPPFYTLVLPGSYAQGQVPLLYVCNRRKNALRFICIWEQ